MTKMFGEADYSPYDGMQAAAFRVFGEEVMAQVAGNEATQETTDQLAGIIGTLCEEQEQTLINMQQAYNLPPMMAPYNARELRGPDGKRLNLKVNPLSLAIFGEDILDQAPFSVSPIDKGMLGRLRGAPASRQYKFRDSLFIDSAHIAWVHRQAYVVKRHWRAHIEAIRPATETDVETTITRLVAAVNHQTQKLAENPPLDVEKMFDQ